MRNKIKFLAAAIAMVAAVGLAAYPALAENSAGSDSTAREKLEQQKEALIEKLKTERENHEKGRIQALTRIAQNQIDRAQKQEDRLANIIVRLKAQRLKMAADTAVSAADLSKIDKMITGADAQKSKVDQDIADAKSKQSALADVLPKVETSIESTTTENSQIDKTKAPTPVVSSVKDFQAAIFKLKKDLIALHTDLTLISKAMRKLAAEQSSHNSAGSGENAGTEENQ